MSEWERARQSWSDSKPLDEIWNPLSRAFFLFMFPLVNHGLKTKRYGPLDREDLPGLPTTLKMNQVELDMHEAWHEERTKPFPRLSHAIYRASQSLLLLGVLCSSIQGLLSAVGRPMVLRLLVTGLQSSSFDMSQAVGYIVLFGLVAFAEGWLGVMGRQILAEQFGTRFQQSLSSLVIAKVGVIDMQAYENGPLPGGGAVGGLDATVAAARDDDEDVLPTLTVEETEVSFVEPEIQQKKRRFRFLGKKWRKPRAAAACTQQQPVAETSLLGNDLIRSYENIRAASQLPMAITSVIGGVCVLASTVGLSSLTGLAIMALILLLNICISRISFFLEKRNMRMADERLGIIASIIDSVRAVKLFGWENKFLKRVEAIREREMVGIAKYRMTHVTNIVMGRASPVLSSMVTLIVFAMSGEGTLSISTAFVTVSVFQSLRLALIMIPLATQSLMAVFVSIGRMEHYLLAKELPACEDDNEAEEEGPLAQVSGNASVQFSATTQPVLQDIELQVLRGQSLAVCGQVGSGKTTLLRLTLGLLHPVSGESKVCAHVGYVPQRALLIGGTLRDNILMGREYDSDRFNLAIDKSQLRQDLALLAQGDMCEIGERGTTLSGGQQQRLSMCRALYSQPKLLVLDDPFSAVDARVCKEMFQRCVLDEVQRGTGVLLAINQLSLLPQCDQVLFLDEQRIQQRGTFQHCFSANPAFARFVESFTSLEHDAVEEEEDENELVVPNSTAAVEDEFEDVAMEQQQQEPAQAESILQTEKRSQGAVSNQVYADYISAFGPAFALLCCFFVVAGYVIMVVNDYWLSVWAQAERTRDRNTQSTEYYITVFAVLSCLFALCILTGSFLLVLGGVRASKTLHNEIIHKVVCAPLSWFESGTTGRIMSRFSGDVSRVDLYLSLTIDNAFQLVVQLLATVVTVCVIISPYLAIISLAAIVLFVLLLVAIDRTLRETKRLANAALSPVLSNIHETTAGLRQVGRAFGAKEFQEMQVFFKQRHEIAADEYSRANFYSGSLLNFAFLSAHVIAFFVAIASAILIVALQGEYDDSLLGLALTYALVIPYLSSMAAMSLTNMNMSFTSLERLLEYKFLPQEPAPILPRDPKPNKWPSQGEVVFDRVEARYRQGLPLCLKRVSFTIRAGESVGIVGRTGSGKSSLVAVLFRLIDTCSGAVRIDGVDITTVGLDALRSRITIIPQEPVLMSGTVRYNLDPFGERTDAELLFALQRAGLRTLTLADLIDKQGGNMSAGERQLLCFARALCLTQNRIVVMDEPSSSLDMQTDGTIVQLVQDELRMVRRCTILTVAHRMETIIQADRVLVMRDGQVAEFDHPGVLLRKQNSEFKQIVNALGPAASSRLLHLAETAVSSLNFKKQVVDNESV